MKKPSALQQKIVMTEAALETDRAAEATQHLIKMVLMKLKTYAPDLSRKALHLICTSIIHAYKQGMRAGSKKRWEVVMEIGTDPKLTAVTYIVAMNVVKTSHDLVEADGIPISLPGEIRSVKCKS